MGGNECKQKIHWLAWNNVSKSKEEGGLGVKNIRVGSIREVVVEV